MTFNAEEKFQLEKVFSQEVQVDNLKSFLPDDIYEFLKERDYLKTVSDKIVWRKSNAFRPFATCIITKFLHEKVDIFDLLQKMTENLEFEYLLFCDFHFMVTCPAKDTDESDLIDEIDDSKRVFKFQKASKASAFNSHIKFSNNKDVNTLLESISNYGPSDFLKAAFNHHSDLFSFHGSDLRPYMLLSLVLHIQKIN